MHALALEVFQNLIDGNLKRSPAPIGVVVVHLAHRLLALLDQQAVGDAGLNLCAAQLVGVAAGRVLDQFLAVGHDGELLGLHLQLVAYLDGGVATVLPVGVRDRHKVRAHHVRRDVINGVVLFGQGVAVHLHLTGLEHPLNTQTALVVLILRGNHAVDQAVGA